MEIEKGKLKAKRKIKSLDFSGDNAAVALVSRSQGGAANGAETLLMKSTASEEYLQKMQAVKVTLSTPEFLRRFFGLYHEDADVLAAMMGYVEEESPETEVEDWVQERLQSFEVIKSLYESDNLEKSLAELNEKEYLALLQDQELVEKALKESESVKSEDDTSTASEVIKGGQSSEKLGVKPSKLTKGKTMGKDQSNSEVEMVEKAALVSIEKALADSMVELEKAKLTIAAFEKAQKDQVIKSKRDAIAGVIKDAGQAEVIAKAALMIEDQSEFDSFISVIKQMQDRLGKSSLFEEVGASGSVADLPVGDTVSLVKAAIAKQNK